MRRTRGAANLAAASTTAGSGALMNGMAALPAWVWPVALSPFVGSFLGVVIRRFEEPRTILFGRSACASCGAALSARDLVPFASWLAAGGRCRHCGARLGLFYPAIEAAALGVAVWSALAVPDWMLWQSCILGWALLALAAIDFEHYVLPDHLTLPLILAGVAAAQIDKAPPLADAAIGAACGFALVILLRWAYYRVRGREGIGLGDAKLLAASGAWVSWSGLPSVVLIAALAGLVHAAIRARRGGGIDAAARVPFGTFLCLGTWIVWLYGPLQIGLPWLDFSASQS